MQQEMEETEDLKNELEADFSDPAPPTLYQLLGELAGERSAEERDRRRQILVTLGLSGEEDERISLVTFRSVLGNNLHLNSSFLYRQVFNALNRQQMKGYLTADQLIGLLVVLTHGPFQAQVDLGLRVYGKPAPGTPDEDRNKIENFEIIQQDAILSIVESLQLCSPRAVHTLHTQKRESAYRVGEDLISLIFPKLDVDGDGVISRSDFTQACHDDPSLVQVFGQFLPKDCVVVPEPGEPLYQEVATAAPQEIRRPRSSVGTFENVDYMKHSPTMAIMWGRADQRKGDDNRISSERLQPIPVLNETFSNKLGSKNSIMRAKPK